MFIYSTSEFLKTSYFVALNIPYLMPLWFLFIYFDIAIIKYKI